LEKTFFTQHIYDFTGNPYDNKHQNLEFETPDISRLGASHAKMLRAIARKTAVVMMKSSPVSNLPLTIKIIK
jgi:hypothetical protein